VRRDDLDAAGKKVYDDHMAEGINLGGPGPVSLRMWDPPVAEHGHAMNQYVRNKAGLSRDVVELVILTTTRELNAEFEYSGHEPAGLKAGLSQQVIDAVKFRRPLTGLPERDAAIIQLTREAVGQRKVSPETFARAERLFGKKALVTMGAIMGEYNSAAILLAIAGQQMPAGRKSLLPVETR
jgi:4-carboxymuconolactone decarboxylase